MFSQTTGTATLNLSNGKIDLNLKNMPQPTLVPYELQVYYRPNTAESLGYFQPDGLNQVDTEFVIVTEASAPVEYYYELPGSGAGKGQGEDIHIVHRIGMGENCGCGQRQRHSTGNNSQDL